ncbi:guanine nucleotide exchange factor DBS-like [Dendronephthya gigantea]|uniref:guanine nucleotide exchange factor DBS-like n=1 Tax=Dendronephthya gigantea TaxID=151771 RepID=UPI001069F0BD|nr:guanine nucleotide exchange factor DBS-like [Dendronephthya gigantea]
MDEQDTSTAFLDECGNKDDDKWIWEGFVGEGDVGFPKLKTIDVAQLLQTKSVYVSGGVDKSGSPLIIFPPNNVFEHINDTDIEKIFHYLVQRFRPDERKKGFTAIVDRRSEKWASVKLVLSRLQILFTATIQNVYVIKPQGFFQKYSESSFKSSLAHSFEVKILDDVSSLYEHVDKNQLTPCLGGTLNYDHQEWVQHRTAIDRFGETCRSIASRLVTLKQIFDKTDLSVSDSQETEHVLDVHGQMWFDVRDDINNAQMIGNTQLKCMKGADSPDKQTFSLLPISETSVQDLQALVEKISRVRDKFEKVWENHQSCVLQSLQFTFFKREFLDVKNLLMDTHDNLSNMKELGDSASSAAKLKKDTDNFKEETKDAVSKLTELCERGEEMIKNNHHYSQSIREKCTELEDLNKDLNKKLEQRKQNLDKSIEVHESLHQVGTWCNAGVDILASQPLDRFQSTEGAEKALKEIDEFLKKPQGVNLGKLNRMEKTAKELGDEVLLEQVRMALKRISEVTEMMSNREASFKKMVTKRPVQQVAPVPPPSVQTSPQLKLPLQPKKKEGTSPLLHLKKDNKSPKLASPTNQRRPISIVITPDSGSPNLSALTQTEERPRSSSLNSPRTSNNIDVEDDEAVLKKRVQVMNELVETERVYVNDLQCVVEGYMKEYQDGSPNLPRELRGKKGIIFGNIKEIYVFHRDIFLRELEICLDQPLLVGQVFMAKENEFQMYASYCKNKPSSEALRKECADVPFFQECQQKLGHQLPLHSYLLKPIQRITKYQLILKQLIKYSQNSQESLTSLENALQGMMKVLKNLNDVMHSTYIRGFLGSLSDQGKLLMQDSFVVWQSNRKHVINVNIAHFKGKPRQIFLYEKMVVFTKRDDEAAKDTVYYQCKISLKLIDIGLTETVKEDPLKFGLWLQNKSEFYTLQAPSEDVKKCWVQEIRRLLQSQFSKVKESRSHSTSAIPTDSQQPITQIVSPGFTNNNTEQYEVLENNYEENDDYDDDDDEWSDDSEWSNEDEQPNNDEKEPEVIYTAIADYTTYEESELGFTQGDLLQVLKVGDGGWWYARSQRTSQEGWVPGSYMEIREDVNSK